MYNPDGGFLRFSSDMQCGKSTYHLWKTILAKVATEAYWDDVRDSEAFLSTRISEKNFDQRRLELKRQFSVKQVSAGAGAEKKPGLPRSRPGVPMANVVQGAPVLANAVNAGDATPAATSAAAAVAKAAAAAAAGAGDGAAGKRE
jgi:hypothetical protein